MDIQNSKINDELKNQNAKIIQNEVMVNNHEKILNNLYQSNEKQKDLITKHEIIINRQQDSIMNCIQNVKDLYKEANEIKHNLLEENSKLNAFCQKNNVEIEGLKKVCQDEINKVNSITEVLNKHTEILTENSAAYAKIQALTYQNCDKIDEICKQLFNHETRIKDIEGRLDKVEAILAEHEKALNDIVGDVAEMKNIMKNIIQRVEKLETEVHVNKAEYKAERIEDFMEKFDEEGLYEFAEFINGLRSQNEPFNLNQVIEGVKLILEKHKKINNNKI
jgi:chromosome segregation ATPase